MHPNLERVVGRWLVCLFQTVESTPIRHEGKRIKNGFEYSVYFFFQVQVIIESAPVIVFVVAIQVPEFTRFFVRLAQVAVTVLVLDDHVHTVADEAPLGPRR